MQIKIKLAAILEEKRLIIVFTIRVQTIRRACDAHVNVIVKRYADHRLRGILLGAYNSVVEELAEKNSQRRQLTCIWQHLYTRCHAKICITQLTLIGAQFPFCHRPAWTHMFHVMIVF